MCFYYVIVKKNPRKLLKSGVINAKQLDLFEESHLLNGFDPPLLPVITENNEISFFEWGLLPSYIDNPSERKKFREKYNTLNAKSETIFESRTYGEDILK